jgi:hypothetical protein
MMAHRLLPTFDLTTRYNLNSMASSTLFWSVGIGFFLGFAFGVGCALAVMYSIYMGGYRAAIRDSQLAEPPERYRDALRKLTGEPPQP